MNLQNDVPPPAMDLQSQHVVVTAGGTREPIDPIRFIGNRSSGKMGFALADAARERGARVMLITTVPPPRPDAYDLVQHVETVAEMREAVLTACESADARPAKIVPRLASHQTRAMRVCAWRVALTDGRAAIAVDPEDPRHSTGTDVRAMGCRAVAYDTADPWHPAR